MYILSFHNGEELDILEHLSHPVDEVLVPWVVGSDDREDVPIVLLHDVEHDGRLLLYRRPKLEEHGVVILPSRKQT